MQAAVAAAAGGWRSEGAQPATASRDHGLDQAGAAGSVRCSPQLSSLEV